MGRPELEEWGAERQTGTDTGTEIDRKTERREGEGQKQTQIRETQREVQRQRQTQRLRQGRDRETVRAQGWSAGSQGALCSQQGQEPAGLCGILWGTSCP